VREEIMKKRLLLSLVIASLILGGLSGIVYAVGEHKPMHGEKLLGIGPLGTQPSTGVTYNTLFLFTNPDDSEDITIERLSVIRGDGEPVYEGPLVRGFGENRVIISTMAPHEIMGINLRQLMWTGGGEPDNVVDPDNWMSIDDAMAQRIWTYTVEIAWEAEGSVTPLTGWHRKIRSEPVGEEWETTATEIPMVNLKQR
jgi:hypothetical protein